MTRLRVILLAMIGGLACLMGGCGPSAQQLSAGFQSEDPGDRITAIHAAGQARDARAVPFLVDRLTDSEQDVRFFAILALKRTTGRTMGYNYYDPPAERTEAVQRWRQWLQDGRPETPTAQETISPDGQNHE